jgi:hypothetical protein
VSAGLAVDVSLDDLRMGNARLRRGATGTSGLPSYPCSLCSQPVVRGQRFVALTPYPYLGPPVIAHLNHVPALRQRQQTTP